MLGEVDDLLNVLGFLDGAQESGNVLPLLVLGLLLRVDLGALVSALLFLLHFV